MGNIRIHQASEVNWVVASEGGPAALREHMSKREGDSRVGFHEMGTENSLQLFEVKLLPNTEATVHCHDEEEIMYVVGGSMRIGSREIGPGSSIYIEGSTYYGFSSGDEGLHFLNFRPRLDLSFNPKKKAL